MKKLLSALLAICMVCMFAVPVFADANDDYIAAVKAYQQKIAAKEAAYTAAVNAYSKQAKAKADADSAAILKAAKAAQAKADAECLAVIAAGKAAHLGGVVAAFTPLPVIGVPMKTSDLGGMDSLLSMVQMPSGVPVACVAINGAKNAAIYATQILGACDPEYRKVIEKMKQEMADA